jgi:hypothetical protein
MESCICAVPSFCVGWRYDGRTETEHEQIIRQHLPSGHFASVEEMLDTALASLPRQDPRFDREDRREAVQRMLEFADKRRLSLG